MPETTIHVRDRLAGIILQAAQEAQRQGLLPSVALPEVALEHPQDPDNGDYASTLPLKLARSARINPMTIAQKILEVMPQPEEVERAWAAPPGYINLLLKREWVKSQVKAILDAGDAYGTLTIGNGESVQVEFVSVNPTGPVHVGHARGAVLGSALANILTSAGYQVQREYYVNDAGAQMEAFYRSVYARYLQALGRDALMPDNGYWGDYLVELGKEIAQQHGDRFARLPEDEAIAQLGAMGRERMLTLIRDNLQRLGVEFDVWFTEASLYSSGEYDRVMGLLREKGYLEEREGAVWFASSALGEDKDNVVVRSSGAPTYFASDIAYHYNKFAIRSFRRVIDVWGADHQGHVSRMKAVAVALGIDPSKLQIIIAQMVTLKRGDEVVKMSKRSGDLITLRELLDEVGQDACRFFFLSHSANSQMDFDLELAKKQSEDNPVYYVQYAHARIASIMRLAKERDIDYSDGDISLLGDDAEIALIRKMLLLPELVETAARNLEPHWLPYYAMELATAFHWFYQQCRVVSTDTALTKARLKLVKACQIVLAKTLSLMGMSAPESM